MSKTSNKQTPNPPKIGIVIGAGTGPILADIFEKFLRKITHNNITILRSPDTVAGETNLYHSFKSIDDAAGNDKDAFKRLSFEDAMRLKAVMENWYSQGVKAVFRTAINAESLYIFRKEVQAVKEFGIHTPDGRSVLFIRDQGEGYYANKDYTIGEEVIDFSGQFTKMHQQNLVKHSLDRAWSRFKSRDFGKYVICKHHLFGDKLEDWYREAAQREGVFDLKIWQPDTGLTYLNNYFYPDNLDRYPKQLLVICANEFGDIVYEALMKMFDPTAKLYFYSKNFYLASPFDGKFGEYQTIHGSADDLTDPNAPPDKIQELLPFSTLSIAAEIAQEILKIEGIKTRVDNLIIEIRRNIKDYSGYTQMVNDIFSHFN